MPQAGEWVAGKYILQNPIGEGGFGEVWLAEHAVLGTPVAVKFLRKHPERLLREAETAATLEHPHIVRVLQVDTAHAAIVMEYVDGADLKTWAEQHRPSRRQILRILGQVADALDFIHQKGLVHGDVKPTNILISDHRGSPWAKLADFGMTASPEELHGGTLPYLAPEQVRRLLGEAVRIDGRADQYALAVMAYELLTHRRPFPGTGDLYALLTQRREPPRPVYEVNPDVPPPFDAPLHRALAYEPGERYPTCRALVAALEEAERTAQQDLARPLREKILQALREKDAEQAEKLLGQLRSTLGGRLDAEGEHLQTYLAMLRAWQQARAALLEALDARPDLHDAQDLIPILAPERLSRRQRVRRAFPQVLVALLLSLPLGLAFFILALHFIARRGAP